MPKKIWNVGDILTASDMNTYVGNQVPVICTSTTMPGGPADGQMAFQTDTQKMYVWSAAAGAWQPWSVQNISCVAFRGIAMNYANATWTVVPLDSELYDVGGLHSTASNTSRIQVQQSGLYEIAGKVSFANNGAGVRGGQINTNSGGLITSGGVVDQVFTPAQSTASASVTLLHPGYTLNAGDYLEMFGFQSSGGSLAADIGYSSRTYLSARLVNFLS